MKPLTQERLTATMLTLPNCEMRWKPPPRNSELKRLITGSCNMVDLTNQEFAVLLLADDGESLIPIGIWEKPIKTLATLGLLKKQDGANYVITAEGHAARIARDENDETEMQRILSGSKGNGTIGAISSGDGEDDTGAIPSVGLKDE